ncbi:MAG: ethanolamine ammonia-lyase reactivating factor EutA [Rhizobiaceae bacterium]|nr:ethanolamine ammonia-lyase reactivating factor EutA [Rhizobiaceae bacterium]
MSQDEDQGGRIFFSSAGRSMELEDEIRLTSVGIDIGSSTSHLAFSLIVLERLDTRYMVVERKLLHQSDVLLTPYTKESTIDAQALGAFIAEQYKAAGIDAEGIDTGALILTGVAVQRKNARAIGELFSVQAGKFVVLSAGDALETTLAAFGSGSVARSELERRRILNVDIGGGTSKLALCENGTIRHITAIDVGARLLAFDDDRRIVRVEEAGAKFADLAGVNAQLGTILSPQNARKICECMADRLFEAMQGRSADKQTLDLYRLPPLPPVDPPDLIIVSGGVSEFLNGEVESDFNDLGRELATCLRARLKGWPPKLEQAPAGIRATVVGVSQYTVQVSGSTIFVEPLDLLPVRNIPVVKPAFTFAEEINPGEVAEQIQKALEERELDGREGTVTISYEWEGSATFHRLDGFCRGIAAGLASTLAAGHPIVLAGNRDIGGLIGIHCAQELKLQKLISVDGISLEQFDYIDVGKILPASGAVPVVVKSLVFPR